MMVKIDNYLNKILLGKCEEVLKDFPENSIDAIVTDPPYGISFMNRKWDYKVPSVEIWEECLRVLKPGGHLLSFAGTRTQHRMAINIEDAGFEIRDMLAWIYGSGFPKSLNIGKEVDEILGNEREIIGKNRSIQFIEKGINENKDYGQSDGLFGKYGHNIDVTKGNSEWEGWGTNLKPALEPITLARKPIEENTIAENVLKYRTGAINIDACRIPTKENWIREKGTVAGLGGEFLKGKKEIPRENNNLGRFPSNLIHDGSEEVLAVFPETKSGFMKKGTKRLMSDNPNKNCYGEWKPDEVENDTYGDEGNAARFFYCAKASKSERNYGLREFEDKNFGFFRLNKVSKMQNIHPTVKPLELMTYLIKLITPENGIVLDPFVGSGTTCIAAKREGYNFIGIEKEKEFYEIAKARVEKTVCEKQLLLNLT